MSCYTLHVTGESQKNRDGSDRQTILWKTKPGDPVRLVREPDNPYDEDAVAVYVKHGQIGYVSRDYLHWLAPMLDEGMDVKAIVHAVRGGTGDKPSLGALIQVVTAGNTFEPVEPDERDRRMAARGRGGLSPLAWIAIVAGLALVLSWFS